MMNIRIINAYFADNREKIAIRAFRFAERNMHIKRARFHIIRLEKRKIVERPIAEHKLAFDVSAVHRPVIS